MQASRVYHMPAAQPVPYHGMHGYQQPDARLVLLCALRLYLLLHRVRVRRHELLCNGSEMRAGSLSRCRLARST